MRSFVAERGPPNPISNIFVRTCVANYHNVMSFATYRLFDRYFLDFLSASFLHVPRVTQTQRKP